MNQDDLSPSVVPFDLDEDSVPDAVAVDTDADSVADVVAFDLDEDSVPDVVMVEVDGDGTADAVTGFDLAEDLPTAAAVSDGGAAEDQDLQDDSFTPPEDITDEDVGQAQQDLQHSQLMNQYMHDTGVISY